jgi:cytochrome c oxidase subunit IV
MNFFDFLLDKICNFITTLITICIGIVILPLIIVFLLIVIMIIGFDYCLGFFMNFFGKEGDKWI